MATKSHKSFFMPLLCRSSLNDAIKPAKFNDSSSADPSSPKLSCIGQIKKRSTATTTTITTTTTSTTANNNNNNNKRFLCNLPDSATGTATANAKSSVQSNRYGYTKLQKLFSSKNLISPAIDTASVNKFNTKCVTKRSKSCNDRGRAPIRLHEGCATSTIATSNNHDVVSVVVNEELNLNLNFNLDLDPPLPVVKCRRSDHEPNVTLWKRRGIEVQTLQIQPIQLSLNQNTSKFSIPTSAPTF